MSSPEVPVLIAGAGPAGLAAAATLALHGVSSLVVERRSGPSTHPRATTVSTRTMELVRALGAEDDVAPHTVDVDWLLLRVPTMARAAEGVAVEVGLPTRAQAALISPSAPACVAQDRLEWALVATLRRRGVGDVWFGAELTRFTVCADGVRATVRTAGGTREVRARHLVAADGARSAVREALGIPVHGSDDVLGAVTALVRAPLWDVVGDRRFGIYAAVEPGAEGTFLPWAPGDRWGFGVLTEVAGGAPPLPSADEMLVRLRRSAGVPDLPVEVERIGWFTSAARLAERFREGPVFLTGDAAHRVTPRGGTGMNTAFHDGHDLGGGSRGSTTAGRRRRCWTATRRSDGPSRSTTWHARPTRTAPPAPRARSFAWTSAGGSPTTGSPATAARTPPAARPWTWRGGASPW